MTFLFLFPIYVFVKGIYIHGLKIWGYFLKKIVIPYIQAIKSNQHQYFNFYIVSIFSGKLFFNFNLLCKLKP